MAVLRRWAKILPFCVIKLVSKAYGGIPWWRLCEYFEKNNEDWRGHWLDKDAILLIRKKKGA